MDFGEHRGCRPLRAATAAGAAGTAASVALLLGGCSGAPDPVSVAWERPAWMAEAVQWQEERRTEVQACLDDAGWAIEVNLDGSAGGNFASPEERDRFAADAERCMTMNVRPDVVTAEDWGVFFDRTVDAWHCLTDEGFDIPAPPSKDTWVDQMVRVTAGTTDWGENPEPIWNPHGEVAGRLTALRFHELEQICPQPWW